MTHKAENKLRSTQIDHLNQPATIRLFNWGTGNGWTDQDGYRHWTFNEVPGQMDDYREFEEVRYWHVTRSPSGVQTGILNQKWFDFRPEATVKTCVVDDYRGLTDFEIKYLLGFTGDA